MSNENEMVKPLRNTSIELLRIISMVMIIFHHFAYHGGFEWDANDVTIPRFWYNFIMLQGKVGSNIFILISGYFLINDNKTIFNFKKILKFWGQVFFYSIAIFVIFTLLKVSDFNIESLINAIFPITFSKWWFASTYFVLFIIHPFLNKLLNSLDKKLYQSLLLMLVILWCVIPTFTTKQYQGNSLLWFVTLYAIAGYVRIYGFNSKFTSKHYFIFWIVFSILTYATSVVFTIMGSHYSIFSEHATYFYGQEKLPTLLISLSLFMTFITLKMNYHKWINVISSATFGVYLIHDNITVRQFLWANVFKNVQYQNSIMLIPYSIITVVIVYVVCTIIELLRQKLIEKPYMTLVNRYSDKLLKPFASICSFFMKIVFDDKEF